MTPLTVADLGDPDLYTTDGRFGMWDELSRADAVHWSQPGHAPDGFWSVFSYSACKAVLAPSGPFTSRLGMMIGFDAGHPDPSAGQMLVVSDGEAHSHLRKLIGPFLSRAQATSITGVVHAEVLRLLEQCPAGRLDAATEFGPWLPAAVVCELLGVPASERPRLVELTNHAFGADDEAFSEMSRAEAHSEILLYFFELIEHRRKHPGTDLVSAMVTDSGLSNHEVILNCDNILIGGNETTRHALTGGFYALAQTDGLLDRLASDPSLLAPMVEETLRWTSPAMHVLRVATEDVLLAGRQVLAGQAVVAWLPAANRDEQVFPEPHRFLPERSPNRHIAFGHGLHHCLGAALARLELTELFRVLAERYDRVRLLADPAWLRATVVQGYRSLPVELRHRR